VKSTTHPNNKNIGEYSDPYVDGARAERRMIEQQYHLVPKSKAASKTAAEMASEIQRGLIADGVPVSPSQRMKIILPVIEGALAQTEVPGPHYEQCASCQGTGLYLNLAGEPDDCQECKGNTVTLVQPTVLRSAEISTPFDRHHFKRILAMAYGADGTWDFSDNDKSALEWVCKRLDALNAALETQEKTLQNRLTATEAMCERLAGALMTCKTSMDGMDYERDKDIEAFCKYRAWADNKASDALTAYEKHKKEMGA